MEPATEVTDPLDQPTGRQGKDGRLSLRASERQLDLLRQAAAAQGRSLTDFVLSTATEKAEEILVERRHFVAGPEAWDTFIEALDHPPTPNAALIGLFQDPDL